MLVRAYLLRSYAARVEEGGGVLEPSRLLEPTAPVVLGLAVLREFERRLLAPAEDLRVSAANPVLSPEPLVRSSDARVLRLSASVRALASRG